MLGLEEMENYVSRRQNAATQYIVTQPVLYLCLETELRPRSRVPKRWWEKEGLDIVGLWEAAEWGWDRVGGWSG